MVRRSPGQEPVAGSAEHERARWMAAAQRGDATAYDLLLTALLPPLRAFVRRRGVATDEVEDVVQEILLLIHRARHTWRTHRPFDPWLWAIARNASTDALRRQARERSRRGDNPGHEGVEALEATLPGDGGAASPEALLAARELAPTLALALSRIPAAQREAVELLYLEQLPVTEAAARAGVRPAALKVRAHRGLRALRRALRSEPSP